MQDDVNLMFIKFQANTLNTADESFELSIALKFFLMYLLHFFRSQIIRLFVSSRRKHPNDHSPEKLGVTSSARDSLLHVVEESGEKKTDVEVLSLIRSLANTTVLSATIFIDDPSYVPSVDSTGYSDTRMRPRKNRPG